MPSAPVWNGNEPWLVVIGTSLFAAFPAAYVVFMGAYYITVLLLLFGLMVRLLITSPKNKCTLASQLMEGPSWEKEPFACELQFSLFF